MKNCMAKNILFLLQIILLSGCFTQKRYEFEIIYSLPLDFKSKETQVFELDGIRTEKIFLYGQPGEYVYSKGPYIVSLCVDDIYDNKKKLRYKIREVQMSVTVIAEGFKKYHNKDVANGWQFDGWEITTEGGKRTNSRGYESKVVTKFCNFNGWEITYFYLPIDFDLGQKLVLSFQILKDEKNFFSSLTNPRLVISAGSSWY